MYIQERSSRVSGWDSVPEPSQEGWGPHSDLGSGQPSLFLPAALRGLEPGRQVTRAQLCRVGDQGTCGGTPESFQLPEPSLPVSLPSMPEAGRPGPQEQGAAARPSSESLVLLSPHPGCPPAMPGDEASATLGQAAGDRLCPGQVSATHVPQQVPRAVEVWEPSPAFACHRRLSSRAWGQP